MPKFVVGDFVYVGGKGFRYRVREVIAYWCPVRGEVNAYRVGSLLDGVFGAFDIFERPGSQIAVWYEEGLLSAGDMSTAHQAEPASERPREARSRASGIPPRPFMSPDGSRSTYQCDTRYVPGYGDPIPETISCRCVIRNVDDPENDNQFLRKAMTEKAVANKSIIEQILKGQKK